MRWNRGLRALAALLLLSLLAGCGEASVFSEDAGTDHLYVVCEGYSGVHSAQVDLSENACINIQCGFTRKGGEVAVSIADEAGGEVYAGTVAEDASFVVQLTEPGKYMIHAQPSAYTGSFSFDWETVGASGS